MNDEIPVALRQRPRHETRVDIPVRIPHVEGIDRDDLEIPEQKAQVLRQNEIRFVRKGTDDQIHRAFLGDEDLRPFLIEAFDAERLEVLELVKYDDAALAGLLVQAIAQRQKLREYIVLFPAVEIEDNGPDARNGPGDEAGSFFDKEIEVFAQGGIAVLQEIVQHAADEPPAEDLHRLVAYVEVHLDETVIAEPAQEARNDGRLADQFRADQAYVLTIPVMEPFDPLLDDIQILGASEEYFLHVLTGSDKNADSAKPLLCVFRNGLPGCLPARWSGRA